MRVTVTLAIIYLNLHVDRTAPKEVKGSIDPWDVPAPSGP